MNKFPFTPIGVAAMCQHFFELPDTDLQAAANELAEDFTQWVQTTFSLSESQTKYLMSIAPRVLAFMAANAAFALSNRLPITLQKAETVEPEPDDSKVTKPKSNLSATILPNGVFSAQGELVIEITYQKVSSRTA